MISKRATPKSVSEGFFCRVLSQGIPKRIRRAHACRFRRNRPTLSEPRFFHNPKRERGILLQSPHQIPQSGNPLRRLIKPHECAAHQTKTPRFAHTNRGVGQLVKLSRRWLLVALLLHLNAGGRLAVSDLRCRLFLGRWRRCRVATNDYCQQRESDQVFHRT